MLKKQILDVFSDESYWLFLQRFGWESWYRSRVCQINIKLQQINLLALKYSG